MKNWAAWVAEKAGQVGTVAIVIIIIITSMIIVFTIIIIVAPIITIIITRPKPAYGRHGLAGSWGQDTDEVSTFVVFLTSHFAPAALSSDLTNLGPLTMESDQKP